MSDKTPEEQFEALAEKMISEAESIKCPVDVFIQGLRDMADKLNERADLG